MKNFLTIYFILITISVSLFAEDYNCREYKNIDISKNDRTKYSFDKEKKLFYKKETFSIEDKKVVIEHYDYEGILNRKDAFFIKIFDINNKLLVKKNLKKNIYKFQAIKKAKEIILVLSVANGEGSNIEIISIDEQLNFNQVYKIEGRDGSFDKHDSFTLGNIESNTKGGFVVAIQLSIFHSAKFTKNYGDFVIFYQFDKNNKLQWKKDLEIPYGTKYEESDNGMIYIENNHLRRPILYNRVTNLKNINGCYLIYNDISNLYKYYAIDSDGYFWTRDPNATNKVKEFLFPQSQEMSQKDWISFIGFLLLLSGYFVYRKMK